MEYGQQASNALAQDIRDASLRNKADEAQKYLINAHGVLDELEDAIHGPQPRSGAVQGSGAPAPGHPGLRAVLSDNSASAAMLMSRLQTLLGSL